MTKTTAYDYDSIETAVMETDRGRWFLAEFARRQRSADTEALLKAIHKLEAVMTSHVIPVAGEALCGELAAMAAALEATEHDMRAVRNDLLADHGAVADGRAVFEDVAMCARKLATGLADTAGALQATTNGMRQDAAIAGRICGLDDDLARLEEHGLTQDVLSQRITKAMSLIAHLQDRIRASLADAGATAAASSPAPPVGEDMPSASEVSYFDTDSELFLAAATTADAAVAMAADDPENAPHLVDMLDDALAGMEHQGEAAPGDRKASEPAPVAAASSQPAPAEASCEAPADAPAPRRVVIVRSTPPAAPPPGLAAEAASAPPAAGDIEVAEPTTPAASPDAGPQSGPQSGPEPDAILKMFTDAAAKYGAAPAAPAPPAPQQVTTAPPAQEVAAAPLESITPGPEERRRIIVIRRASSADTPIPLEDSAEAAAAGAKN